MKEVSICVLGHCYYLEDNRRGCYEVIMSYKGHKLKHTSEMYYNTTSNRMIIQGMIKGIEMLKEPCHIKFFSKASIGLSTYLKKYKGINSDLLEILVDKCNEKGCEFEFILISDADMKKALE